MAIVIKSLGIIGLECYVIDVEAAVLNGIATMNIVGLGDAAVKESKDTAVPGIFSTKCHIFRERGELFVYGKGNKNSGWKCSWDEFFNRLHII